MNLRLVASILAEMRILLIPAAQIGWASQLLAAEKLLEIDRTGARTEVLRLFGGMGSLNDLVLYRNGELLHKQTDHLHALIQALYIALHTD